MANYVGDKIREARTAAGLTMTALADSVDGVTAADIGKAERGEKELTQAALKQIAKATGVTQKSLLEAAAKSTYGSGKKAAAKSATKKTTARSAAGTTAKADGVKLTKAETELLELYRAADKETKAGAIALLKGEQGPGFITELLSGLAGGSQKKASSKSKKAAEDDQGLKGILGEFLKGI